MTGQVRIASEGNERFIYYMTSLEFQAGSGDDPTKPDVVSFWKEHDMRYVFILRSGPEYMSAGSFIRKRMFSLGFIIREIQIPYPDANVYNKYASLCLLLYSGLKTGSILILSSDAVLVDSVLAAFLISLGMSADKALEHLGLGVDAGLPGLRFFLSVYASFLIRVS